MSEAAEKLDDDLEPEASDETPAQEAVEVPEQVKPVGVNRFGLAAEKRNHYLVNVPHGTNPKAALEPEFWEHISLHLGRGDVITVEPDDLAWEMSVKVIDKGHNWAHVKMREMFDYHGPMEVRSEVPSKYKVEWGGQTDKFRVIFNKEVLKAGFATEFLASQYASNHAQALKR